MLCSFRKGIALIVVTVSPITKKYYQVHENYLYSRFLNRIKYLIQENAVVGMQKIIRTLSALFLPQMVQRHSHLGQKEAHIGLEVSVLCLSFATPAAFISNTE